MSLIVYSPGREADVLMTGIYASIIGAGDEERCLHSNSKILTGFLHMMEEADPALIDIDEQGPWFLAWYTPCLDGAYFATWCHPRKRTSRDNVRNHLDALTIGAEQYPAILSITKQPALLPAHKKIGLIPVARIPNLWDGEAGYMMHLDMEMHKAAREKYKHLWRIPLSILHGILDANFQRYEDAAVIDQPDICMVA